MIKKQHLRDPEKLFSRVRVYNSDGEPQAGVNLLLQNKEKKNVSGFMSNDDGEFPPLSIYDDYIQYFTISWIGSGEISIPTDSLFGYRTEIQVHLENSTATYENLNKRAKFLIIRHRGEILELKALDAKPNNIIQLRKI